MSKNKGFTLIELLVVILIIGILATLVIVNVSNARKSARDAKRIADLKSIQTALEMYYEKYKAYPTGLKADGSPAVTTGQRAGCVDNWCGRCDTYNSNHDTPNTFTNSGATGWIPNLASEFIAVLPSDPKPNGGGGCYIYQSNGTDYAVLAHGTMETCVDNSSGDPDCSDPGNPTSIQEMATLKQYEGTASIGVYTNGASGW